MVGTARPVSAVGPGRQRRAQARTPARSANWYSLVEAEDLQPAGQKAVVHQVHLLLVVETQTASRLVDQVLKNGRLGTHGRLHERINTEVRRLVMHNGSIVVGNFFVPLGAYQVLVFHIFLHVFCIDHNVLISIEAGVHVFEIQHMTKFMQHLVSLQELDRLVKFEFINHTSKHFSPKLTLWPPPPALTSRSTVKQL